MTEPFYDPDRRLSSSGEADDAARDAGGAAGGEDHHDFPEDALDDIAPVSEGWPSASDDASSRELDEGREGDTAVLGALAGGAYDRETDQRYYRPEGEDGPADEDDVGEPALVATPAPGKARRLTGAGLTIALLLGLLGFTLVVQVKSNSTDAAFASQREGDLLQIMSDLDSAERRLQQDIQALENAKRDLQSGVAGQAAAQEEAKKRADALGILAGTLEATGPGVEVKIVAGNEPINANDLLSAVQDLRIGDAEAIQINGNEASVRVIASTSFVDADGGIRVDGVRLTGPYTVLAIGQPELLKGALEFAGGVVPRLSRAGGNVIVNMKNPVEIKAIRTVSALQYAEPVS